MENTELDWKKPTRKIVRYINRIGFRDIPKEVVEYVKLLTLDSLANMIGGIALEPARLVSEVFSAMAGRPEATVFATGDKLPVCHAAYVNSYLANVLDFDDTYASMIGHPSATVIPPALAMAEKTGSTGKELLTACVAAYEVMLRISNAVLPTPERDQEVCGYSGKQIFGSVAAVCKLLKLDEQRISYAFGIAGHSAPVPALRKEGMSPGEGPVGWIKNNYGWAAMGGMLSAILAQKGFVGNQYIFDGDRGFWIMSGSDQCHWPSFTQELGSRYLLKDIAFKPYATCRWTHAALDATIKIISSNQFKEEEISGILVKSFGEAVMNLSEPVPDNSISAQFSLPYLIAITLLGHSPDQGLREEELQNPRVGALAQKVKIELWQEADRAFKEEAEIPASVAISLYNGERIEETVYIPRGDRRNPCTGEELLKKFHALVIPVLGEIKAGRLEEVVWDLENLEDIGKIYHIISGRKIR